MTMTNSYSLTAMLAPPCPILPLADGSIFCILRLSRVQILCLKCVVAAHEKLPNNHQQHIAACRVLL